MLGRLQEGYAGSYKAKLKTISTSHLREDGGLDQDGGSRYGEKLLDLGDISEIWPTEIVLCSEHRV